MALPLHFSCRETSKRRLASLGPQEGLLTGAVGSPCASPPKVKARRLENPSTSIFLAPHGSAAATATATTTRASHLRARSPLSSPLKRRVQSPLSDEGGRTSTAATAAAAAAGSPTSQMLKSPVRLHFPLSSSSASRAAPQLPAFPSAASSSVAITTAAAAAAEKVPNGALTSPQRLQRPHGVGVRGFCSVRGAPGPPLPLDALSFLTSAAAAAAAAAAEPGSPRGSTAGGEVLQQQASFLAEPTSPFSTSRRRRAGPAAAAAADSVMAAAASTPSPTRQHSSRGPTTGDPMDYKASPVSSRRRASPYHGSSSSSASVAAAAAAGLESEALSPFRLTPPRKKPQFSFDSVLVDQTAQQQQQQQPQQEQQAAGGCEVRLTQQELSALQRLFSEQQQQRLDGFSCNSLDSCAAAEAPLEAVKLNRQLERLCRLYGLLRMLFDRLHERGEPLLLFSVILPAYSKLAVAHLPRSASEPSPRIDSSSSNSGNSSCIGRESSVYGISPGSSRVRTDLIKDVGRLVWLLPHLLQWRPRKLRSNARSSAAPTAAALSPLQQQQQQFDIQIVELKDGVQISSRAKDGDDRQQQLRRRLVAYTLQWQNCCLQQQLQQQQQLLRKEDEVGLLRRSRELLMQHGRWAPGFSLETVPSPPSTTPPDLQQLQQQQLLLRQPSEAFKGGPLGRSAGSSAQSTSRQQQQHVGSADGPENQTQQQHQLQISSKFVSPSATSVALSNEASVDCSARDLTPPQGPCADGGGQAESSPPLLSPLSRGRQPLRRLPLLLSSADSRSPSPPLERRSASNSASPTRSPVSERLRRKTEERMAARRQQEAAKQLRRELYENVQRLREAQVALHCLLDACVYEDRRSRIDIRVLTDLFVNKVRTPLSLQAVERAVMFLESLSASAIELRSNVISLSPALDPVGLRKTVELKLTEAEEAAIAADASQPAAS